MKATEKPFLSPSDMKVDLTLDDLKICERYLSALIDQVIYDPPRHKRYKKNAKRPYQINTFKRDKLLFEAKEISKLIEEKTLHHAYILYTKDSAA